MARPNYEDLEHPGGSDTEQEARRAAFVEHQRRTQIGTWHEDAPFREDFLLLVPDRKEESTVRHFGKLLFSGILQYFLENSASCNSFRQEIRAALRDLRHVEGRLALLGEDQGYRGKELILCRLAAQKAFELALVGDKLERALSRGRRRQARNNG